MPTQENPSQEALSTWLSVDHMVCLAPTLSLPTVNDKDRAILSSSPRSASSTKHAALWWGGKSAGLGSGRELWVPLLQT